MDAWPGKVHGFKVGKRPIDSGVAIRKPVVGVLHTTEGGTAESAWSYLRSQGYCPHFIVDANSIIQCRSLSETSSTLRHSDSAPYSPNLHAVQIEIAAFSQPKLWQLSKAAFERVAAVMAFSSKFHDIPLAVPNEWPDDCKDMPPPWAAENSRRKWARAPVGGGLHRYPSIRGWWEHKEVPWQNPTWHWDAGALRRSELIARARSLLGEKAGEGLGEPGGQAQPAGQPQAPAWPGRYLKLLSPMMRGQDVRAFQGAMDRRGYPIVVDGWFGPQTNGVTIDFQSKQDLRVDGTVGPDTWGEAFET